jgi:hypothetical protein
LIAWLSIVRVNDLVKDRRPPKAAALRAVLDKIIHPNKDAVQAIKAAFCDRADAPQLCGLSSPAKKADDIALLLVVTSGLASTQSKEQGE